MKKNITKTKRRKATHPHRETNTADKTHSGRGQKYIQAHIHTHLHTHRPTPTVTEYMNGRKKEGNHPARTKVKDIRPDPQQRETCSMPRRKNNELLNQEAEHQHDRGRK